MKNIKANNNGSGGFTLWELLVVLFVFAGVVLALLALPGELTLVLLVWAVAPCVVALGVGYVYGRFFRKGGRS